VGGSGNTQDMGESSNRYVQLQIQFTSNRLTFQMVLPQKADRQKADRQKADMDKSFIFYYYKIELQI